MTALLYGFQNTKLTRKKNFGGVHLRSDSSNFRLRSIPGKILLYFLKKRSVVEEIQGRHGQGLGGQAGRDRRCSDQVMAAAVPDSPQGIVFGQEGHDGTVFFLPPPTIPPEKRRAPPPLRFRSSSPPPLGARSTSGRPSACPSRFRGGNGYPRQSSRVGRKSDRFPGQLFVLGRQELEHPYFPPFG